MTLLLRRVHYVLREGASRGACRDAGVASAELEGAVLDVELRWDRDAGAEGVDAGLADFPISATVEAPFDPAGARGTWHLAGDCPHPTR